MYYNWVQAIVYTHSYSNNVTVVTYRMMQALVDRLVPLLLRQLLQDYDKWVQQKFEEFAWILSGRSPPLLLYMCVYAYNRRYEWNILPFGLINAPPEFLRIMNEIFNPYSKFLIGYIDDVIIFSSNIKQHFRHLFIVKQNKTD